MSDGRTPLNHAPRSWAGSVKVTSADLDQNGISIGALLLAQGSILVGNVSGVAAALSAKTTGQILVGNGTTLISVAVSGDATLTAAGVLTIGAGKVTGIKASTAMATRLIQVAIPTVATTGTTECLVLMPDAGTVTGVFWVFKDTLAQDATNWVRFSLLNKTQANALVLGNVDANTTKTTTGTPSTGYLLTIGTLGAGVAVNGGDCLAFQAVQNGTAANTLTEGYLMVKVNVPT